MRTMKAKTTSEWMRALSPLTEQFGLSEAERKELSFNVAEILSDVCAFVESKPSGAALRLLVSQIQSHWPYHQAELKPLGARLAAKTGVRKARAPQSKRQGRSAGARLRPDDQHVIRRVRQHPLGHRARQEPVDR